MAIREVRADPYAYAWRDLWRREVIIWCVTLSFLPAMLLSMLALSALRSDVPKNFAIWVAGGWIAALVAAYLYRQYFHCPRCCHLFYARESNYAGQRCAHCQLPVGARTDPVVDDA